jgi:hypothetical protein
MEKISAQRNVSARVLPTCSRQTNLMAARSSLPTTCRQHLYVIRFLFTLVTFTLLSVVALSAANFTALLDRETISLGESAVLKLRFEGAQPETMPAPPTIPNVQVGSQGTSQEFSFVNGASSSSVTASYALMPTQVGDYTIPSFKVVLDGKTFTSPPLRLKVVKASAPPTGVPNPDAAGQSAQLAFMRLVLPKKDVFVGETIVATLELYLDNRIQRLDGFNITSLPADGLTVGNRAQGQNRRVRIGNNIWTVVPLSMAVTPVKSGQLNLGPILANAVIALPARDFFEQFRGGNQQQVSLATDAETLQSLPLPKDNVPSTFSGAVGNYTMTATAGPTNIAAGDPITIKIQITGSGALDSIALPTQDWHDFKLYLPTTKPAETTDQLGVSGTKTFEQLVVPQSADIKELPPISFSFFDPEKKKYETLTQPSIALIVRPGGQGVLPTVAATTRGQEAPPTQDIVSIKQRPGKLEPIRAPLIQRPWFVAVQAVPLLAFVGAVFVRKRNESLANNPRLRRQRKVAQIIREGLAELRKCAVEKNSDQFFATLFRLLQEQLGAQLNVPASAITEAVIEDHLKPRGVPEKTLADLQELFQANNLARYAPIKSTQELEAFIPKLENVLRELQEVEA